MLEKETLGYRKRNDFPRIILNTTTTHGDLVLHLSNQPVFTSQSSYMIGSQQAAKGNLVPTTGLMKREHTLQINLSSELAWPCTSHVTLQSPLWPPSLSLFLLAWGSQG